MCFSARVSFGAAIALGAVGVVSMRSAPSRSYLPVAAMPFVFALQQASEGCVWLVLEASPWHRSDASITRAFLFFALLVWPAYVPAALLPIEPIKARRFALGVMSTGGAVLGVYLFGCSTLRLSDACIAFGNVYYWVQTDTAYKALAPIAYLSLVVASLLTSSVRGTSGLAVAAVTSFGLTALAFRAGFISVWCFFAAALSGIVTIIVRAQRGNAVRSNESNHSPSIAWARRR